MGVGGISIWQLLIILVIVLLLFGTKRLRNIGSDLGGAIKGFRKSVADSEQQQENPQIERKEEEKVVNEESSKNQDKPKV